MTITANNVTAYLRELEPQLDLPEDALRAIVHEHRTGHDAEIDTAQLAAMLTAAYAAIGYDEDAAARATRTLARAESIRATGFPPAPRVTITATADDIVAYLVQQYQVNMLYAGLSDDDAEADHYLEQAETLVNLLDRFGMDGYQASALHAHGVDLRVEGQQRREARAVGIDRLEWSGPVIIR